MGFLIALLMSAVFGALAVLRPKAAAYALLCAFALFDEMGPGFTTLRGSFIFNADFVSFAGVRLIEVLTASVYIPIVFFARRTQDTTASLFVTEKTLALLFAALIVALTLLEYVLAGSITVASWRLILTGAMQFHILVKVLRTEHDIEQFTKVLLILLGIKAGFGLFMWAIGFGVMSPRGKLPFFWDSHQVEAFGLGAVILVSYLMNYSAINPKHRFLSAGWATIIAVLLLAAVLGSIRRTIWMTTLLGVISVLVISRRTTILHYFSVVFIAATVLGAMLLLPGLDSFRSHMGQYVESLNLFDDYQRSKNAENDVHLDNVVQYTKMIIENPDILAAGTFGPSGLTYKEVLQGRYSGEFPLGMAHNGILRTVLFFGILGLIVYLIFYAVSFRRAWVIYWKASDEFSVKHIALASAAVLILNFLATLSFVPPFWTSSKGLFYTFIQVVLIGIALPILLAHRAVPATVHAQKAKHGQSVVTVR
jgi:hypothetical protein